MARIAMQVSEADTAALLPHAGRSRLIRRVIAADDESICCEGIAADDPLFALAHDGRVDAAIAIEYGAQAMAAHGALRARQAGDGPAVRIGYLISVHDVRLGVERLDRIAGALEVHARRVLELDDRVSYEFAVRAGGIELASGRVNVSLRGERPAH